MSVKTSKPGPNVFFISLFVKLIFSLFFTIISYDEINPFLSKRFCAKSKDVKI